MTLNLVSGCYIHNLDGEGAQGTCCDAKIYHLAVAAAVYVELGLMGMSLPSKYWTKKLLATEKFQSNLQIPT